MARRQTTTFKHVQSLLDRLNEKYGLQLGMEKHFGWVQLVDLRDSKPIKTVNMPKADMYRFLLYLEKGIEIGIIVRGNQINNGEGVNSLRPLIEGSYIAINP